jgi:hypothetical protein
MMDMIFVVWRTCNQSTATWMPKLPVSPVSGKTVGDGILLKGSTMTLSGSGVNSGVTVLDQLSSSGSETSRWSL